jgi:hypothetical protein
VPENGAHVEAGIGTGIGEGIDLANHYSFIRIIGVKGEWGKGNNSS